MPEAANAAEGIGLVEAHHPDLVVLDLMLPVKDGWWFFGEVQQPGPRLVVMIPSARSGEAEGLMAQRGSERRRSWMKPFEPAEIVRRGRSLIGPTHEGRASA